MLAAVLAREMRQNEANTAVLLEQCGIRFGQLKRAQAQTNHTGARAAKAAARWGARQPAWEYRPPEYRYIPTGKLVACIVTTSTYYESSKREDTVRGTIELKVQKAVRSVADGALRRNVENELRAERELVRRTRAQEWDVAKTNKDALLAKLAMFEKMAKDLDRARSLRRFIDEIAASNSVPADLAGSLELMALMADWLDPLVKAPWPEVDDVGDRNPHESLW